MNNLILLIAAHINRKHTMKSGWPPADDWKYLTDMVVKFDSRLMIHEMIMPKEAIKECDKYYNVYGKRKIK